MKLVAQINGVNNNYDRPLLTGELFTLRFKSVFPILSRGASFHNFSEDIAFDSTIRTQFEDGTVLSRARFTTMKKSFPNRAYSYITSTDKAKLETLQRNVSVGSRTFFWTNPTDDTEYEVRLLSPMRFQVEPRNFDYWGVILSMAEA